MYDPNTGRWTSEDPIGFTAGDYDLYRYVGNNPPNFTDRSGLDRDFLSIARGPGVWDAMRFWEGAIGGKGNLAKMRQGCLGLAKVRFGLDISPFLLSDNENVKCFTTFKAADDYRQTFKNDDTVRPRIFVVQMSSPQAIKWRDEHKNAKTIDQKTLRSLFDVSSRNVATLHEPDPDERGYFGKLGPCDPFWEYMDVGWLIAPYDEAKPKVKHITSGDSSNPVSNFPKTFDLNIYCVIVLKEDQWKSNDLLPPSKFDPERTKADR